MFNWEVQEGIHSLAPGQAMHILISTCLLMLAFSSENISPLSNSQAYF